MKKSTLKLFVLFSLIGLNFACQKKREDNPGPITVVDSKVETRQARLESNLAALNLNYESGYRTYSSGQNIVSPCQPELVATLESARKEATGIVDSMEAQTVHRDEHGEEAFRGKALDLFRKIRASAESLAQISGVLSKYCETDAKKINVCLNQDQPIRVYFNFHQVGFAPVQAILRPNAQSRIYFFAGEDQTEVRTKSFPDGADHNRRSLEIFSEQTSRPELQRIADCLNGQMLLSELGKQIARSAKMAVTDVEQQCRELALLPATASNSAIALERPFCRNGTNLPGK